MEGSVRILYALVSAPDEIRQETMGIEFPPGQEDAACARTLQTIMQMQGLLRKLPTGGFAFTPMHQIKHLEVSAPAIVSANLGDIDINALPRDYVKGKC